MSIQHSRQVQHAFSLSTETTFGTPMSNASLNKLRTARNFAPIRLLTQNITDRTGYGKPGGHSRSTYVDRIGETWELATKEHSLTDLELLWMLQLIMGVPVSDQPDDVGQPTLYRHINSWQSTATNKEVVTTNLVEKLGSEWTRILTGLHLSSCTIRGNRDDHVVGSYGGFGRAFYKSTDATNWATGGAYTLPTTVSPASFLKTLFGTVNFGDADVALPAVSADVLEYEFTLNQNPDPYALMGNGSGKEKLLSKVLIGDQTVTGSITFFVSAAYRDLFTDETPVGLSLVLSADGTASANVVEGQTIQSTLSLPRAIPSEEGLSENGQTVAYTLTYDETSVIDTTGSNGGTFTTLTGIDATELGQAA